MLAEARERTGRVTDGLSRLCFQVEQLLNRTAADSRRSPLEAQIEIARALNSMLMQAEDSLADAGILGAAFLFSDSGADGWSLFERLGKRGQGDPQLAQAFEAVTSVSTPYVIRPEPGTSTCPKTLRRLVHSMFVEVRELQERVSETGRAEPEFFAWLPQAGRSTPFPRETALRDLLSVHYVGAAELRIALATWRTLQVQASMERTGQLAQLDADTLAPGVPESWLGLPLASIRDEESELGAFARGLASDQGVWLDECRDLLGGAAEREALILFADQLEIDLEEMRESPLTAETICCLAEAYSRAVTGIPAHSAQARLLAFERAARAPLPPYFFWHQGEGKGRAHLVAPVWTSAMNPLRFGEGEEESIQPAVGLALCAVAPIEELEASLATSSAHGDSGFSNTLTILSVLRQISRPLVEFVFYEPAKSRERSAQANQLVAAIMSRNLSHNIGSHVLYHLREELEMRTPDQVPDLLLPELVKERRIANLVKYLQARMDFIALVSSEGSTWPGVVSLDSLRAPYADPDSLLLKHIVKSQRLKPPTVTVRSEGERPKGPKENIDFAIPTGAVGAQAVYSIIENFIRNSAKYGIAPIDAPLEITLTIGSDPEWPDHWQCILEDNNRSVLESARRVVENFDRPIFDHRDPGQSHRNWGLKEIKIASLFLAGGVDTIRAQYDPTRPAYSGPVPQWILSDIADEACNLKLRFHLMRPLGICLLGRQAVPAFKSAPLMHVFETPEDLLADTGASQLRYELLVLDREAVESIGSQQSVTTLFQRAMRISYVGEPLDREVQEPDPDVLQLAGSWSDLAALVAERDELPGHAIGRIWVDKRWPGRRTVFASANPRAEPEIKALVDRTVKEFTEKPPPKNCGNWLVWDHTRHKDNARDNPPIFERFAFHRPVSHPVRVGLGVGDGSWRLKEAACLQIGVVDERIWGSRDKTAKDQGYKKVPPYAGSLLHAWRRAGLQILNSGCVDLWFDHNEDLSHPLLDGRAGGPHRSELFDFLVVHRSLVDKAASLEVERNQVSARRGGPDARDEYVRQIMGWLKLATNKLVVTSGRGLEPAYHKVLDSTGAGFVEFSALADALIDNTGDKVGIVKLLRSV